MNERDTDEKFLELRRATEELRPSNDFSDRVMRAIDAEPLPRSNRRTRTASLALFAMAAAAAVLVSLRAQSTLDEYALSAFESVELEQ
jgi:hypothetical protein